MSEFDNPGYVPPDETFDFGDDDRPDETAPLIIPFSTSTPGAEGGENIEMRTRLHETSGLPEKSFVETSFSGQKTRDAAWDAAKELFPNMSSSELEVSYDTKGKLQVKMFGSGKKLYRLMSTDRSTKEPVINKSLPKEIKTALGQSKYEKVQQITSAKRKELKQSEDMAQQREKNKKDMEEAAEALKKANENLEAF